jgi:hypothetical protein
MGGCVLYFCCLLAETNNFGLGTVLLRYLVSELQKPPFRESNSEHISEFQPSYALFLVSKYKHAKFGRNRFIPSRAIGKHTNKHTYIPTTSTLCVCKIPCFKWLYIYFCSLISVTHCTQAELWNVMSSSQNLMFHNSYRTLTSDK